MTGLIRYWAASSSETSSLTGICKHRPQVLGSEPKPCSPHLASHLVKPSDGHHVLMQSLLALATRKVRFRSWLQHVRTHKHTAFCSRRAECCPAYKVPKREKDGLPPGAASVPTKPWQRRGTLVQKHTAALLRMRRVQMNIPDSPQTH